MKMVQMAVAAAAMMVSGSAVALPVTFTGIVTNDVTDTIKIRQPDGTLTTYTGPKPDYPYKKGDQVTISFDAGVLQPGLPESFYAPGTLSADGLYRFRLTADRSIGTTYGIAQINTMDVSGPITGTPGFGNQGSFVSGLTLVYDARAKSYSLEFPQNSWVAGKWDGPGFSYDPVTGLATSSNTTCSADRSFGGCDGGFNIGGSGVGIVDTVSMAATGPGLPSGAPIFGPDASDPAPGVFRRIWGFFTGPTLSGSWNLPVGGSGGSTSVPEPGMAILFASGVAAMMRRRRKAKAA